MAFSSIQKKKCKCGCNLWPTLGYQGYHHDHHPDPDFKKNKIDQAQARQKTRTAATNASDKLRRGISTDNKLEDNEAKKKFEAQQLWFEEIKRREQPVCWETGDKIPISYMRAATAHLLAKKPGIGGFPSVSTHPLNYAILSPLNGMHQRYDSSWEKAQGMKIWPLVVERFKKIYPYIAPAERKYLPDCLLQWIEPDQVDAYIPPVAEGFIREYVKGGFTFDIKPWDALNDINEKK